MTQIVFGEYQKAKYVWCEVCNKPERILKPENAHFVNEWLDETSPPKRHVFCGQHYRIYVEQINGRQASIPVPCSNTGVTPP